MFKAIFITILGVIIFLLSPILLAMITGRTFLLDNIDLDRNITTKFIFIFTDHNISVEDKQNYVKKIHYSMTDTIDIKIINNHRIVYIEGGAILKTDNDSIDIEANNIKVGGYMGAFYHQKINFYVDENGDFLSYGSSKHKP